MNKHLKIKGSMTVEASLLLPIFLMLFMNLLSIIEVYRVHSSVAEALWQAGRETAKYYYLKNAGTEITGYSEGADDSGLTGLIMSLADHGKIVKSLETYPVWEKIVAGSKNGFNVHGQIDENGIVTIDCTYSVHPMFLSLTPVSKLLQNHYYGHAWTGYDLSLQGLETESEELYVYITETGTVYHKNRGCSYLNPSIQKVSVAGLDVLRNRGGAIYYACPLCDDRSLGTECFITDYGTNYHTFTGCSGLKRTIYAVKLSEAGGRPPCSKCSR